MAATRTFTANFVGRTSNLEKSFKRVSKGSELMSNKLMRATRMAGIGFGALAGVAIGAAVALKPMIDQAAEMEEALSKNQLLLGESSKAVEAFAETSLQSFGVTNLAALQATGVFANLGKAMNLSEADSASMATTLTGLAGDLSSLHDVSVETALTALRAGLIGEAEPLRKFGIFLDAATLKTKAFAMGLIKNTKDALTPAIKSQAAYALILQEGAIAMGDFTRTSDSATNVSKKLAGQWVEMQIVIGTALLPAFTSIVTHLSEVVLPAMTKFFEEPSWAAMGTLAGDALTSNFVKAFTGGILTGFKEFSYLDPIIWLAYIFGPEAEMKAAAEADGDEIGTALTLGFAAAITQFGRDNPDWYRGDWDPEASGTTDGTTYGAAAAAAAAGAMAPGPGFPPFAPVIPPPGPMAPGPGFPPDMPPPFVPPPTIPGPLVPPDKPFVPPPAPMIPGPGFPPDKPFVPPAPVIPPPPTIPGPLIPPAPVVPPPPAFTPPPSGLGPGFPPDMPVVPPAAPVVAAETDLEKFLKIVGTTDWDNFLAAQAKPTTTVVINATAVTAPEVIDLMGKYVQANGPLSRQWIGQ